ncbi:MAG TPA: phosphoribosylformylglycinamidine cyclo-ligase [Blastocatellia bacterium]|jgi:phosphoribosylformylglycinamidine cyclo-ligase|nr:phosphoribosylformylglycinamidine cyclo-ligase [Blastocatellia bacterium]
MTEEFSYRDAGVDIDAANDAKSRIRRLARETFTPNVMTEIGSFGGMFRADFGQMHEPVLVSSADGVGTKLRVAFMTGIHNTVGRDLVGHCVNDILVQGARPLFFLDYIASGKMVPETVAQIVEGLADGCKEAGCALIGGETAEMPGFYADGEYDVAGFIVGVVDRRHIIDGSRIQTGDLLIGLPSVGLHTNGYSLARKLFFEVAGYSPNTFVDELGCTVGEELLKPHPSYLRALDGLLESGIIRGLVHITGGGLLENPPRILPEGTSAEINAGSWPALPVFDLLARLGKVPDGEMYRTFNMGIGMVIVVAASDAGAIRSHLEQQGTKHYDIGRIVEGDGSVSIGPRQGVR